MTMWLNSEDEKVICKNQDESLDSTLGIAWQNQRN